jgi:hypothetical protein
VEKNPALCENAPWLQTQPAGGGGSGGDPPSDAAKPSKAAAKSTPAKAPAMHLVAYPVVDQENRHYQLFMRSTYGAYNYIGTLLSQGTDIDNLQVPDKSGYGGIINLNTGSLLDCFAQVRYRDIDYCVLNDATNTKILFALLHQLQQLQTAPANVPTTLTVTSIP